MQKGEIPTYKVALIGGPNVGKTTMINYFLTGKFAETANSVQASCVKKIMDVNGQKVQLEIWDTAGQERYRSVGPLFFRNAVACIAVYDLTEPKSLEALDGYLSDYNECFERGGYVIIAGNKSDLVSQDVEDPLSLGRDYAMAENWEVFSTSGKTGAGINELFYQVALNCSERKNLENTAVSDLTGGNKQEKSSCC